ETESLVIVVSRGGVGAWGRGRAGRWAKTGVARTTRAAHEAAKREGVMAADSTARGAGRLPGGLRDSAVASAPYRSREPPALDSLSSTTCPPLYEHTRPHGADGIVPACRSTACAAKDGDGSGHE